MSCWRIDDFAARLPPPLTEAAATTPARRAERDAEHEAPPPVEHEQGRDLATAVAALEAWVREMERDLQFRIDEASGRIVVSVIDGASGDVIRQIPAEEVLRIAAGLDARGLNLLDPRGVRA